MTKQTIEIDVPEGYEIDLISKSALNPGKEIPYFDITVYLKKKEPEFIEVREYLYRGVLGQVICSSIQKNLDQEIATIGSSPNFIKWLDEDWRKIYV